jgi:hypothetical protein
MAASKLQWPGSGYAIYRDPLFWGLAILTLIVHIRFLFTQGIDYSIGWVYVDEGYRLYPGLRLLRGEELFRNMFTAYPPLSFYFHEIAYALLGVKVSSVRIVLICSQLATTLCVYALARYLMNRWFALFAAFFTIAYGIVNLNMGYSGWYVVPFMLIATLFLFRWIRSDCANKRELLGVGLAAGLAIATKLRDGCWVTIGCLVAILAVHVLKDFVPGRGRLNRFNPLYAGHLLLPVIVVLMLGENIISPGRLVFFLLPNLLLCAALLIRQLFFTREVHTRVGELMAVILIFFVGVAVVTLPWVLYYSFSIGPDLLWEHLVIIPMGLKVRMNQWPSSFFPIIEWAVCGGIVTAVLAFFSVLGPRRWRGLFLWFLTGWILIIPVSAWFGPSAWMNNLWTAALLFVMLPLASGLAILYAAVHLQQPGHRVQFIMVLGVMNGVVLMTLHPWTDFNHWLWTCAPAFIIFSFAASRLYDILAKRAIHSRWLVVAASCAILAYSMPVVLHYVRGDMPLVRLRNSPSGDMPMNPVPAGEIEQIIDFINQNVPEDGYILEIPGSLYSFLSGRRQAARLDYFWVLDGRLWDEERELELIRRNNPRIALVRTGLPDWRSAFPKISNYVDNNYVPYGNVGQVWILKR